MDRMDSSLKIWLDVGLNSSNTLRFIDLRQLYEQLGPKVSKALAVFQAFTRSNYTASLSCRGKTASETASEKS